MPRRVGLRPVVGPRPVQGGVAAGANPVEMKALGLQKTAAAIAAAQAGGRMDEQRLRLERLRREAIRRKLNRS